MAAGGFYKKKKKRNVNKRFFYVKKGVIRRSYQFCSVKTSKGQTEKKTLKNKKKKRV
jgi:hypothetical protein